ncbi:MAG TPA: hypothetical protein PKA50_12320, partial [Gemmatimonadales bacterium]|nr:hypothetical protein [Gemmatimonadales bacterium]
QQRAPSLEGQCHGVVRVGDARVGRPSLEDGGERLPQGEGDRLPVSTLDATLLVEQQRANRVGPESCLDFLFEAVEY